MNPKKPEYLGVKYLLLCTATLWGWFADTKPVCAQAWTVTSAPSNFWSSVAASADGSKLVATSVYYISGRSNFSQIYLSTNSGAAWTLADVPTNYWRCVSSSADGTKLAAAADSYFSNPGSIWVSTNSGNLWRQTIVPAYQWYGVAASADGSKLVAVGYGNATNLLSTSTDSGANWTTTIAPFQTANYSRGIACSADGNKLAALDYNSGLIYTSTNFGLVWALTDAPNNEWAAIASSADGTKLVAVAADIGPPYDDGIYVSTNSGAAWRLTSAPTGFLWQAVSSSADGTKLAAVDYTRPVVYTSTNSGTTWASNSLPNPGWSIASSADGNKLLAATLLIVNTTNTYVDPTNIYPGQIYTSQSTPSPVLSISPSTSNAVVAWTIPSINFRLQQNSNLTTSNWADITNPPVLNFTNLQNEMTFPRTSDSRFFRLVH